MRRRKDIIRRYGQGLRSVAWVTAIEHVRRIMEARNAVFTKIIQGNCQFIIPVFQRDFSWTVEQCRQLWRDVWRASDGGAAGEHFIGSIVYIEADQPGAGFQRWLLIDGQQRLTTLTLLLIALRDHIQESDWFGGENDPTTEKIDDYYLKNRLEKGDRHYKLVLRRKDNETLQALVDRNDPSEPGEHEKCSELLIEAYDYFRSELKGCDPGDVYRGITSLNIVDVTLKQGVDNPQLVFESMNSTGVDLRQSDLVRNFLLMELDESDQKRLYNDYWHRIESYFRASEDAFDSFLRDYMALEQGSTQPIRLDRVYEEFKTFRIRDRERPLQELLGHMMRMARTYASFLGVAPMQRPWLAEAMNHMRSLGTTQGLLIMRLYDCHEKGRLSDDEFVRAVGLIESYLLRRAVLGWQTRGYWSVFARIAHDLNRQSVESIFESLQVAFARLTGNNLFPGDEEFRRDIKDRNLYALRVCKHILNRLENAGQGEPSPVDSFSIEHIMPQEINGVPEWQEMLGEDWIECHASYLHKLGNLTLTAYNSTYSNRPFDEKQNIEGGFKQSAVRLNRDVRDQATWTAEEINSRGNRLADRALEIWPYHDADAERVQAAHVRELKERAAQQKASDLEMDDAVRDLFDGILEKIRAFPDVIEVIENRSICCYGPEFFAELLPMSYYVRIILPLDLGELANHDELTVYDASTWRSVPNRVHKESNLLVDVGKMEDIAPAVSIIRQALGHGR